MKAIDYFESLFIPSGSAALRQDCSLANKYRDAKTFEDARLRAFIFVRVF